MLKWCSFYRNLTFLGVGMAVSKMINLHFKTTRIYYLHSKQLCLWVDYKDDFQTLCICLESQSPFLRNWQWDCPNGWSELYPGMAGPRSRSCLTECSCTVSQPVEAGWTLLWVTELSKGLTGEGHSFLQTEEGVFIKWLIGEVFLYCFHFPEIL